MLLWFTINSQSKVKIFNILFLRNLQKKKKKKLATKFSNVSWWVFWIGDPKKLHKSFLVKTFIWTWIFFKQCKVHSFKNEIKIFQKRCKSSKNCVDTARHRSKTLKKRKKTTKNEEKSNNSFLLLLFCIGKLIFC